MYRCDLPTIQLCEYCSFFNAHFLFFVSSTVFVHVFLLGHKDSVTCATFSHDSTLVASGDMSGLIKVWKVEAKEEIWSFEVGDLEVCKLNPVRF